MEDRSDAARRTRPTSGELPVTESVTAVPVASARGAYPVLVGRGLLARLPTIVREHAPAHRYAVISDDTVAELYGRAATGVLQRAGAAARLFTFPAGEASKTRDAWARISDEMLAWGMGRDGVVVAVGGGVTGDLAGFVAATYLRGVPIVQVPTSLLAMVDASVGGKTAVDVPAGKNLVGAFHPPRVVISDPDAIATLPAEEVAQGLAEALKHGAVLDRAYLEALVRDAPALRAGEPERVRRVVVRSVEIKARVVADDEHEAGFRQILNFGHTVGHALEAASGYTLRHGLAVAAGMIVEANIGERLGVTESGTSDALRRAAEAIGLGRLSPQAVEGTAWLAFLTSDKKSRGGAARYVLLRRVGQVDSRAGWTHEVPDAVVRASAAAVGLCGDRSA